MRWLGVWMIVVLVCGCGSSPEADPISIATDSSTGSAPAGDGAGGSVFDAVPSDPNWDDPIVRDVPSDDPEDSPVTGLGPLRAFPGAEGFGADSVCGRGGRLFVVQTQSDLDACILHDGPRTCVFAVSGTFRPPSVRTPFLTIAGQTAPSPGVQFTPNLDIRTHDVCVRHVRVRGNGQGDAVHINYANDGLDQNEQTYNIVLDQMSVSWSGDENISSYAGPGNAVDGQPGTPSGRVSNVTISNSISSEGLLPHSMGFLAARPGHDRFTVIGNVFVSNNGRNPKLGSGRFVVANNLVYGHNAPIVLGSSGGVFDGYIAGNSVLTNGTVTRRESVIEGQTGNVALNTLYVADNALDGLVVADPWSAVNWTGDNLAESVAEPPWFAEAMFVPIAAGNVFDRATRCAGARPMDRDEVDARVVADVINNTGTTISELPPLPDLDGGSHELAAILRSTDPADWTRDSDGDGYTDVEVELNRMASAVECSE